MIGSKTKRFDLKEAYPLIMESINDLIAIVESQDFFKFEYINDPLFMKSLGYTREDLIGRSIFDFMESNDSNKFSTIFKRNTEIKTEKAEFMVKSKEGELKWFEFKGKTFKDSNNKLKLLLILKDLSKYKNLEFSERYYRLIAENANDLIAVFNEKLECEYINEKVLKKILGYSFFDMKGKAAIETIHPDDYEKVINTFREVFKTGEGFGESRIKCKDGSYKWLQSKAKSYLDKGKKKLIIISRDVTEKKKSEKKLKDSEKKYRLLFENTPIGIGTATLEGDLIAMNNTMQQLVGYDFEELKALGIPALYVNINQRNEFIKTLQKNGVVRDYEVKLKGKDGTEFIALLNADLIDIAEKKALHTTVRDITKQKMIKQKLKESEERFKFLVLYSPTMIYSSKTSGDYGATFISENVKDLTGYSSEDFMKNSDFWISEVHPEDKEGVLSILSELSKKERLVYDYRFKFKDGTYHWMRDEVKLIKDKTGNPIETIGSWTDITDLKKAQQKLKESEENFRTISEQSAVGILILQDNIIKYGNQRTSDISGYTVDEIKNWKSKEFLNAVHPEDRDFVMEQAIKKQKGVNDVIPHYYLRIINKNGELKWLDNYSNTITYKGKKADLITFVDITEKIDAEKKLKQSEEKFRSLFDNSPNAILILNIRGEILDCNLTTEKLSGFKKSDLVGKYFLDVSGIPERYIPKVMKEFKVLLKEGITEPYEIQLYTREGTPKWVSIQGSLVNLGEEKIIQATIQDISERMEAELKLKKSEEKYRNIIENTKDIYFEVDLKGNFTYFNDALTEISGYTKEEGIGTNFSKYMAKDNSINTFQTFNEVYNTGIPKKNYLYEFVTKDGKIKYGESSIYLRYDSEGNKIGFSGFLRDTSDKIEAENNLKESEEKFRTITEQSFMGIMIIQDGVIKYANKIVSKIMGYSIEELKSLSTSDYFKKIHPEDVQIAIKRFQQLETGKKDDFPSYPYRVFTKLGDLKWIDVYSKIIKYHGKNAVFASIIDVTLRKEAEQKLKLSEEKFRTITEQSLMGILEYDFKKKNISYANPKLLNILGYDKETSLDKMIFSKSIHPEDIKKFYKSTEKRELEFRLFDKNGKLKWIKGNRLNQYNDDDELLGFIVWLDDITEKKMYEMLIYELNVNFLNFTTDVEKNIQMLLETCCKLLNAEVVLYCHREIENGIEEYQIMSSDKEILNINSEEFKRNFIISEMFQEKHDYTQTFINIDETKFAVTDRYIKEKKVKGCFGKLIMSHEGYNSGLCVFYQKNPFLSHQDILVLFLISDALEIEQRRWQVQQDLEEQNRLKTELLSRTSHELKTPLIAIKGFTDLLLTLHSSKLDTDTISIIEDIREGGVRLEEIINLLLESSRLDQGLLELNKSTEDLSFLIKFVLHGLRGILETRNLKMIVNIHEYLTGSFDKERMYEVISNLLTNAIKYTPPGGEIKITSEIKEKFYVICVEDNGIGFTEDEKSKLFKQFGKIERYGEGLDIDIKGSGLGLYISKKIIELHGGEIWAESEGKHKGSKFYFSLPII